ncbi:MAG TPA: dihydrolipoamide acetyltransferase family protein [Ilumatobacter sp.]
MTTFFLPDIGEGLQEAEIVTWHVGVGDHVVADQPLLSVETDKAVVEIPSPVSGHIAALHGAPGDIVDVGAPLVDFAEGEIADAGAIVGSLPPTDTLPEVPDVPDRRAATSAGHPVGRATPAVRALASAFDVDLATITPTGPHGTITRADVEAAAAAAGGDGAPAAVATDPAIEPLRGVRRAMDANMTRAHSQVVPATVTEEADIGDWPAGTDATVRLLRAVAAACAREPALNATYLGRDAGRRRNDTVDVGIAVDTDDGLFVPVLRDVAHRDASDLRRGLDAMHADIVARTVPPEHLQGATITLSNFGSIGGRHAALVVVPPQVAIVGAGRARDAVVAHDGAIAVRRLLPLSLTFDHRVVMGGEAARFLDALTADLEAPT